MPGYTLPDGLTLKNKLAKTSQEALELAETDYVKSQMVSFALGQGPKGNFDVAHLKAIHRHLFQDVYEGAGRTRDERVMLSDGTVATEPMLRKVDGNAFMRGPLIGEALEKIASRLREQNYLRGLGRAGFARRAAVVMVDLNGVHPFREGNGRTQRLFISELATEAGYKLDFSVVSRERMIQASIVGNDKNDAGMMQRLFDEISDPQRVAALTKAIDALDRHRFRWNNHYVATAEPGYRVEGLRLAGVAGEQFMTRTKTVILIGQTRDLPKPQPEQGREFGLVPTSWRERNDRDRD